MDKIPFGEFANQVLDNITELIKRNIEVRLKEQLNAAKEQDLAKKTEIFEKEKEQWEKQKEEEQRQIEAKNAAFAILKDIPPPMSPKGKNESFPIVRFTYKKDHNWYQTFIIHYADLCRVLRHIHNSEATSEALQIQIAAVVNFKNFPAKDYEDLRNRVRKLVDMLKDINRQYAHGQILEHIRFFEYLEYPEINMPPPFPLPPFPTAFEAIEEEESGESCDQQAEEYITVSLDENPEFRRNGELIREEEEVAAN